MFWRLVFGAGYALMGTLCVAGLLSMQRADFDSSGDWYGALFGTSLLAMVSVGGLVTMLFIPLFARLRRGPVLGTAPSGAPAVCFRRSPFMVVLSVLGTAFLAAWSGLLAVVLYGHGHPVWASLSVLFALVLLWPLAVAAAGKVKVGGLWLTPAGLEYRKEAVSWAMPWSDLRRVDRTDVVPIRVLPDTAGLSRAAVEPLGLVMDVYARLDVRRTVRWVWNREYRMAEWMACIDCFDLAGGRSSIAERIEHYLAHPRDREQIGTEWSLPRRRA